MTSNTFHKTIVAYLQQELLASTRSLRITSIALPANCKLDALPWKNATFPTVLNLLKQIGKQHCCVTSLLYCRVIGPHYRNNTLYYKHRVTIINLWLHALSTKPMNSRELNEYDRRENIKRSFTLKLCLQL